MLSRKPRAKLRTIWYENVQKESFTIRVRNKCVAFDAKFLLQRLLSVKSQIINERSWRTVVSTWLISSEFLQVMSLPYLDMVVSETLRKYPPLGFLDRVCLADYKVPNSDLVIEKNTPVYISVIGNHYNPEYFPNPEKFDPLRFTEEAKNSRPSYIYFPFGEGPRICIGQSNFSLYTKMFFRRLCSYTKSLQKKFESD